MTMGGFQTRYDRCRSAAERYLQGLFPPAGKPYGRLQEAMRYSLLAGGKRVRPVLALAFCELCGGHLEEALPFAAAVECVHTYSLIHDDLPCMDVYGETMAVLAGDALQAEAFRLIAGARDMEAWQRSEAVLVLADACGADGMVAGQVLDTDQLASGEADLRTLCALKTGALIRAAAELGCIAAGAGEDARRRASDYAGHLGLAFQVRDDMLDVTAQEDELGKPIGSDQAAGKRTFVDLLGLDACAGLVARETALACEALSGLADSGFLLELADSLADRRH